MANETTTSVMTNLVLTAYDKLVEFNLRAMPMFRSIADKRPANVTNPGESVVFQLYSDLAPATTPLNEVTDVSVVALPNTSTVSVTLNEYGNAAVLTRRLELDALSSVDAAIADVIAFNMVDTMDSLVKAKLDAGTNYVREIAGTLSYNTGAATSITASDTIKSKHFRFAVAQLRTNKVLPRKGNLYWAGMHPQVSADLRAETGAAAWRDPHVYSAPAQIWAGEIGEYEGAFVQENPRLTNSQAGAGAGASQVRVFNTLFAGKQALAEAVNQEPGIVIGPVVDRLRRLRPVGWYGFLGWGIYRQEALLRLETACSLRPTT